MTENNKHGWRRTFALLMVCLLLGGCSVKQESGADPVLIPTAQAAETPDPNKKTTGML